MRQHLQRKEFMNVPRIASWCIVAVLLSLSAALGVNQGKTLEVLMPENHSRAQVSSDNSGKSIEQGELDPPQGDADAETQDVAAERSLRVLIVDPQRVTADALVQQVRYWGHDGRAAYDGAAGLELAATHVPEVVFLALEMPGMNGSDLAKELRLDARLKRCFLIASTGHSGVWREEHYSQTDIDLFLPKPCDAALLQTLLTLEGKRLGSAQKHQRSVRRVGAFDPTKSQ
jgi:CheY-like chemotaxis protein